MDRILLIGLLAIKLILWSPVQWHVLCRDIARLFLQHRRLQGMRSFICCENDSDNQKNVRSQKNNREFCECNYQYIYLLIKHWCLLSYSCCYLKKASYSSSFKYSSKYFFFFCCTEENKSCRFQNDMKKSKLQIKHGCFWTWSFFHGETAKPARWLSESMFSLLLNQSAVKL